MLTSLPPSVKTPCVSSELAPFNLKQKDCMCWCISGPKASDYVTQTLLPTIFLVFSPPCQLHSQTRHRQVSNMTAKFSRKESFPFPTVWTKVLVLSLLAPISSYTHPGSQSYLWGECSTLIGRPDPMPIQAEGGVNTTQPRRLRRGEAIPQGN